MIHARSPMAGAILSLFDDQWPQGIVITDADLRIEVWNQWMADATAIPATGAVGQPLFDVVPSLVERGIDQYYRSALDGEPKVLSYAFHRFVIPTAGRRAEQMPQSGRIVPLREGGAVVGTVTVVDDVSERVASDRELRGRISNAEAASRVKDEFLATLSHEIRTPLNAVLGWTRILRSRASIDAATLTRAIDVIDRNASAQMTLVSDMLDMARISTGKVRLEMTAVDLAAVALAAVDVVRPAAEARGVRLITDLTPDVPPVSGDFDRLLQVAWNLLSNSVKFTESGGTVTVSLTAVGSAVTLSVIDTGQGIDTAFLPHVFERFRQADASSSRRHGGLGLGLALVKTLVELHGGTVSVWSAGTGTGSTFRVSLPAIGDKPVTTAAVAATAPAPSTRTLDGVRVLLVDDDADAAEIFERTVAEAGAMTAWERSPAHALARLRSNAESCPDVIVSDIGMPEEDGYALLRQVRTLPAECGGTAPLIALTAYVTPEDRSRALREGFVAHIGKPFDPDTLIAVIRTAITT